MKKKYERVIFLLLAFLAVGVSSFTKEIVAPPIIATEPVIELDVEKDAKPLVDTSKEDDVNVIFEDELVLDGSSFMNMATQAAATISAPSGFPGGYGSISLGLGATKRINGVLDGGLGVGMGFGNPETLGGNVSMGFGSINPTDGGAFDRGNLSLSLGRQFGENALSIGVNQVDLWRAKGYYKMDPSFYVSYSRLLVNDVLPGKLTLGLGNNNFNVFTFEGDPLKRVEPFGAIAFYPIPQLSVIIDYTAKITSLGVSFVPFPAHPFTIDFAISDLAKKTGNYELVGSIGYSFNF